MIERERKGCTERAKGHISAQPINSFYPRDEKMCEARVQIYHFSMLPSVESPLLVTRGACASCPRILVASLRFHTSENLRGRARLAWQKIVKHLIFHTWPTLYNCGNELIPESIRWKLIRLRTWWTGKSQPRRMLEFVQNDSNCRSADSILQKLD